MGKSSWQGIVRESSGGSADGDLAVERDPDGGLKTERLERCKGTACRL